LYKRFCIFENIPLFSGWVEVTIPNAKY